MILQGGAAGRLLLADEAAGEPDALPGASWARTVGDEGGHHPDVPEIAEAEEQAVLAEVGRRVP